VQNSNLQDEQERFVADEMSLQKKLQVVEVRKSQMAVLVELVIQSKKDDLHVDVSLYVV